MWSDADYQNQRASVTLSPHLARVAELADAQDSGSCDRKIVGVQLPPRALNYLSRG